MNNATNILRVGVILFFLGLAIWAITLNHLNLQIANREPWLWLTTALVSVGPELAGIVIGVVTIDYLNERRQLEQLKAQLIRHMGSNVRDVAVPAAKELAHHGWLYDGSLSEADLSRTNLNEAPLWGADLSNTIMADANLDKAYLQKAKLRGADLTGAGLSGADLREADLQGANLQLTNLRGVNLWKANLSGCRLVMADLTYSNISQADMSGVDLSGSGLSNARLWEVKLIGASLSGADFSGADIKGADLDGTDMTFANLRDIQNWTIKQLEQAKIFGGAIMPDGIQLQHKGAVDARRIEGPTFKKWRSQYLTKYDGTVTDVRNKGYI